MSVQGDHTDINSCLFLNACVPPPPHAYLSSHQPYCAGEDFTTVWYSKRSFATENRVSGLCIYGSLRWLWLRRWWWWPWWCTCADFWHCGRKLKPQQQLLVFHRSYTCVILMMREYFKSDSNDATNNYFQYQFICWLFSWCQINHLLIKHQTMVHHDVLEHETFKSLEPLICIFARKIAAAGSFFCWPTKRAGYLYL